MVQFSQLGAFPYESTTISKMPFVSPYLSSVVCKVMVIKVNPAPSFNGRNVQIVMKCCGFKVFVKAPDDVPVGW